MKANGSWKARVATALFLAIFTCGLSVLKLFPFGNVLISEFDPLGKSFDATTAQRVTTIPGFVEAYHLFNSPECEVRVLTFTASDPNGGRRYVIDTLPGTSLGMALELLRESGGLSEDLDSRTKQLRSLGSLISKCGLHTPHNGVPPIALAVLTREDAVVSLLVEAGASLDDPFRLPSGAHTTARRLMQNLRARG